MNLAMNFSAKCIFLFCLAWIVPVKALAANDWAAISADRVRVAWRVPPGPKVSTRESVVEVLFCARPGVDEAQRTQCLEELSVIPLESLVVRGSWKLDFSDRKVALYYEHSGETNESLKIAESSVRAGAFPRAELCRLENQRAHCKVVVELSKTMRQARVRVIFAK